MENEIERAIKLVDQNKIDAAIMIFKETLKDDYYGNSRQLFNKITKHLWDIGMYEKALEVCNTTIDDSIPLSYKRRIIKSKADLLSSKLNRKEEAKGLYQQLLRIVNKEIAENKTNYLLYQDKANILVKLNSFEEAITNFELAEQFASEDDELMYIYLDLVFCYDKWACESDDIDLFKKAHSALLNASEYGANLEDYDWLLNAWEEYIG